MAVAVLIVNYQVYDDVDRALTAVEPFLDPTDEVVVVDNASDPARLAWLASRHARARVIGHRENLGFSAGVNLAARNSKQPYLLLLNPDTVMQGPVPRALEQWLRDHPGTGAAGPRVLDQDGRVQASARRFPGMATALGGRSTWLTRRFPNNWVSRRQLPGRESTEPLDVDWLAGSCLMTPRAVFERAGGLDEGFFLYWEDADYCYRLKQLGYISTYVPTVAVRHAGGHSAELVPDLAIRAFHESAIRLHRKHGGWVGRLTWPLATIAMRARASWRLRQAAAERVRLSNSATDARP